MKDEIKVIIAIIMGTTICVTSLIWSIYFYSVNSAKLYSENGYVQDVLPGVPGVYWVKK